MHEFRLTPPAPFCFEKTAAFLSPGADDVIDVYDGKRYTRLLDLNGRLRLALVSSLGTEQRPEIIVTLMNGTERDEHGIVMLLSRMLGLGYDLQPFYKICRQDQLLYGLSSDYFGLRPPQRMHPFEALAIALAAADRRIHFMRTSFSELALQISQKVAYAGDTFYAFPSARVIARQELEALVIESVSPNLARAFHGLANAVVTGRLDLLRLSRAPLEPLLERLRNLPGVGLGGAQLTALFGYGRLDCFPSGDPVLRSWIASNYDSEELLDERAAAAWALRWGRYGGLVALHVYADLIEHDQF